MKRGGEVSGDDEVVRALMELAKGPTVGEIDRSAIASLKPMEKAAKARVRANRNYDGKYPGFPQPDPGRDFVDRGIVSRRIGGSKVKREYRMGARGRARRVLHLLEFGTAPHWQENFRGGFMHPGARPKPAMVPAYEEGKGDIPELFGRELWLYIHAKAVALGRKSRKRR